VGSPVTWLARGRRGTAGFRRLPPRTQLNCQPPPNRVAFRRRASSDRTAVYSLGLVGGKKSPKSKKKEQKAALRATARAIVCDFTAATGRSAVRRSASADQTAADLSDIAALAAVEEMLKKLGLPGLIGIYCRAGPSKIPYSTTV